MTRDRRGGPERFRSLLHRAAPRPRDLVIGPGAAAILALLQMSGPFRPPLADIARDFLLVCGLYLLLAVILNLLLGRRR